MRFEHTKAGTLSGPHDSHVTHRTEALAVTDVTLGCGKLYEMQMNARMIWHHWPSIPQQSSICDPCGRFFIEFREKSVHLGYSGWSIGPIPTTLSFATKMSLH